MKYIIKNSFSLMLFLYTAAVFPAVLMVTSLFDNNLPGTLRTTIANATSGDTIVFTISGVIVLDPAKGELVVDTMVTIDGGDQITIDGSNLIPVCFHITGTNAANSTIKNIRITQFHNTNNDGSAHGILIDDQALYCTATHCTIDNIKSGKKTSNNFLDALATGIASTISTGPITDNTITNLSSQDSDQDYSGNVFGLFLEISSPDGILQVDGDCSRNTITNLCSGTSLINNNNFTSGDVAGLFISDRHLSSVVSIVGDCSHNAITNLKSGTGGYHSGNVNGIILASPSRIEHNCSHNLLTSLSSGPANEESGSCNGIKLDYLGGSYTYNHISHLKTGPANISQAASGVSIITIEHHCAYNTIEQLETGSAQTRSGEINALSLEQLNGNCIGNKVSNVSSGASNSTSSLIRGIRFREGLGGDCINNEVRNLKNGNAPSPESVVGIFLNRMEDGRKLACNLIENLQGGIRVPPSLRVPTRLQFPTGIRLEEGNAISIKGNTIRNITSLPSPTDSTSVFGLILGDETENEFVTNSTISFNTIATLLGENNNGFGITINGANSIGNKILNNSLFDINGMALFISPPAPVDASVKLSSVQCSDGCKLCIDGVVVPAQSSGNSPFLLQFFVSDTNKPEQAKTFIGESIHNTSQGFSFKTKLSGLPPIQAGQYLTATATALTEQNNNTSELSNALVSCMPSNTFCPCSPPQPLPPVCPAVSCSDAEIL